MTGKLAVVIIALIGVCILCFYAGIAGAVIAGLSKLAGG